MTTVKTIIFMYAFLLLSATAMGWKIFPINHSATIRGQWSTLRGIDNHRVSSLHSCKRQPPRIRTTPTAVRCNGSKSTASDDFSPREEGSNPVAKVIHWRGEKEHGNSMQFRQKEFTSALTATVQQRYHETNRLNPSAENPALEIDCLDKHLVFQPALTADFNGALDMNDYQRYSFVNSMQYIAINESHYRVSKSDFIQAIQRCSLVRSVFEILAEGDTYEELALNALQSNNLVDLMEGGSNHDASWRVRLRQYGDQAKLAKQKQYGKKMRSPIQTEREAILQMGDLFKEFTGPVDLKNATVSLYILEGLANARPKVLTRMLTRGASTSRIAPNTRLCITNTPLCPIAAFIMCNVARIQPNFKILDPFCGSCSILLAAAMIESTVQTVGIDIAHDGQVNRTDIMRDFTSRNLALPTALIQGNSMSLSIRNKARNTIGNQSFDAIITDPPYGIREKSDHCIESPLIDLVSCIGHDRIMAEESGSSSKRLLNLGGRLISFVPNPSGEDISKYLPSDELLASAGLKFVDMLEQPLSDSLSRWLVEYECIK